MNKKLVILFLAFISCIASFVGVTACSTKPTDGDNQDIVQPKPEEKPDGKHSHSWAVTWDKNDTHHWHDCTAADCDVTDNAQKDGYAAHAWDNGAETKQATCKEEGVKTYTCTVCLETKTESIPKSETHTCGKWLSDGGTTHTRTCSVCSKTETENHNFESGVCSVCGYINDLLIFKTLDVNDDTVYGKVSNSTTGFSFIKEVTAGTNVTYTVCTDKACKDTIPSKTVNLKVGDNVFYVLAAKGNDLKLYTVTLRRRPVYTVTFNSDGGSYIEPQQIEEDCDITQIGTPLKTGYTFSNWKVGDKEIKLPFTVTETLTFNANYTAKKYNIVFNLSEGDVLETLTAKTTYGEKNTFPVPKNKSYSFEGWYYGATQITDSQGNMISEWNIGEDVSLTSKNKSIFNIVNGEITGLTSEGKRFTEIEILPEINGKEIISINKGVFGDCSSLESITIPFVGANKGGSINTYFGYIFGANEYRENDRYTPKSLKDVFIIEGIASIGNYAFYGCSGLTSVKIPDSVTSIGGSAFSGCCGLTSVMIGNYVTSIGESAFSGCSLLTRVAIPDSVTSIGGYAFNGCSGLMSVIIPDSVTSIGDSAFNGCSSLTSVTIGNGVTSIGGFAFYNCSSLTTANWNAKACTEAGLGGAYIFGYCTKLATVNIGENVTTIPALAFENCSRLTSVKIPDSVTNIGSSAFEDCSGLTSVTIGNGVTSIGGSAFSGCCGLTSVTIGNSVTSIGESAFSGCSNLQYNEYDNCYYLGNDTNSYLVLVEAKSTDISSCLIYENTKIIASYAFGWCSRLTNITIPDGITSIGNGAFSGCSGLTSITIPDSVTIICGSAFSSCHALTIYCEAASKPSGWNSDWNYSNCPVVWDCKNNDKDASGKEYAVINGIRYSLKDGIATVIEQPTNIVTANISPKVNYKNIDYNVTSIGSYAFDGCSSLTSVTIPDSVTSIGVSAFRGCSGLTSVTIPNSVTSISNYAFDGCSSLTSVTIPDSVTSIGVSAFRGCSGLTSVTIPNSVTSISNYAFDGCSSLTSVTIPNSVTSIGNGAFRDCRSLTNITIPESVTSIGERAFYYCRSLTIYCEVASKPDGWSSDWNYSNSDWNYTNCPVVWDCKNNDKDASGEEYAVIDGIRYSLKDGIATVIEQPINIITANIPSKVNYKDNDYNVTSIGNCAFYGHSSLTSITISESVTRIGDRAFHNCSRLTGINYGGTKQQWNDISKGSSWNYNTGNYTIHCTDGDIAKS